MFESHNVFYYEILSFMESDTRELSLTLLDAPELLSLKHTKAKGMMWTISKWTIEMEP